MTASSAEAAVVSRRAAPRALRAELAALALFAVLALVHTWPMGAAPGRWSRNDSADTRLNEWALAWVAHQAATDPLHLFDANIFYPEKRTLALSEHLVPQALMVAPLRWAGASPVTAHNVAVLLGFILTGWAMCHLLRAWTGSWPAGLVGGSLAAFNAHSLTRIAHLQAQHLEFLPLALIALDRLLAQPRLRHALGLGGWFALHGLTSGYLLVFGAVSMAAAGAARAPEWLGRRLREVGPFLLLAVLVAAALLLPFMLPYRYVRLHFNLVRSLGEIGGFSAVLTDYAATGARIHEAWSLPFFRGDSLFPGLVGCLLALGSLAGGVAFRDRRARVFLAIAAVTFCLSFGTSFPLYAWLYRHVPLLDAVRAPIRFGQITLLALAGLAGYGAAWWLRRLPSPRARLAAAAVLVTLVNLEALRAPLYYVPYGGERPIFKRLASERDSLVAYFPFYSVPGAVGGNSTYMLRSPAHWRPMINGYSGFMPASFYRNAAHLDAFPEAPTVEYLRSIGVTHIVVDAERLSTHRRELLQQAEGLPVWGTDGPIRIYRVE